MANIKNETVKRAAFVKAWNTPEAKAAIAAEIEKYRTGELKDTDRYGRRI
jgi:hypothetical protein